MNFYEYAIEAQEFRIFDESKAVEYLATKTLSEFTEWFAMAIFRPDEAYDTRWFSDKFKLELGDHCWEFSQLCLEVFNNPKVVMGSFVLDYQDEPASVYKLDTEQSMYTLLSIFGRIGEHGAKIIREPESKEERVLQISTLCLQVAPIFFAVMSNWGIDFYEVFEMNLNKLHNRRLNGTIKGDGDDR